MRLAAPDLHDATRRTAEAMLPADQVAAHNGKDARQSRKQECAGLASIQRHPYGSSTSMVSTTS